MEGCWDGCWGAHALRVRATHDDAGTETVADTATSLPPTAAPEPTAPPPASPVPLAVSLAFRSCAPPPPPAAAAVPRSTKS